MAIIDHANFHIGGRKIFAYEYPERNLSSNTQLNVRQGQEALLVMGGRIEMKYPPNGPRPYTLDSANLPIVRKLFGIPFGGSNPILASVWFINKADLVNMEIQTDTFLLKDPSKPQGFPAIATANVGIKVEEGEPFFLKLVNGNPCFSEADMIASIRGRISRVISEKISQLVDQLGITVAEINSRLSMISQQSSAVCTQLISEWGLSFVDFNVRVTQDTSKEGLMLASGFGTDMESFERQRILDIQEKAINNLSGGNNGLLGAVLAMGMVNGLNSSPRNHYNNAPAPANGMQQTVSPPSSSAHMVYCANCSKKYDVATMRFCPNCRKEYFPCPKCGSDNLPNTRRCVTCGSPLPSTPQHSMICPRCNKQIEAGTNFCPFCGQPIK